MPPHSGRGAWVHLPGQRRESYPHPVRSRHPLSAGNGGGPTAPDGRCSDRSWRGTAAKAGHLLHTSIPGAGSRRLFGLTGESQIGGALSLMASWAAMQRVAAH